MCKYIDGAECENCIYGKYDGLECDYAMPELTKEQKLWWLVENCKDIKICNYDKTLYFNGHKIWNQEFYFDGTDYNNLTEAINEAYNKAREAQNERD